MRAERSNVLWAGVAAALGVVLVVAVFASSPPSGAVRFELPTFEVQNESRALGRVYHPGVILGAASNGSTELLGGIGVYTKAPEFTLPVLASVSEASGQLEVTNLTPEVNSYFYDGGVYAMAWNGTSWLLGGQAGWGGGSNNFGSLVAYRAGVFENVTALLGGVFVGGGVFAMGWNGSAWLVGGNSSAGPALEAISGTAVTDLSSSLPLRNPLGWVQEIAWNGNAWLVGGQGVFGLLAGSSYTDLWEAAPFEGSGVYAASWNGSAWLAGGGAARLVLVQGRTVGPVPQLGDRFDQSVTFVQAIPGGWLIGGTGTAPSGGFAPELAFWDGLGASATSADLASALPAAFAGGDLQGGCLAPSFGSNALLVVGEGQYDNATGYGIGAMALVTYTTG